MHTFPAALACVSNAFRQALGVQVDDATDEVDAAAMSCVPVLVLALLVVDFVADMFVLVDFVMVLLVSATAPCVDVTFPPAFDEGEDLLVWTLLEADLVLLLLPLLPLAALLLLLLKAILDDTDEEEEAGAVLVVDAFVADDLADVEEETLDLEALEDDLLAETEDAELTLLLLEATACEDDEVEDECVEGDDTEVFADLAVVLFEVLDSLVVLLLLAAVLLGVGIEITGAVLDEEEEEEEEDVLLDGIGTTVDVLETDTRVVLLTGAIERVLESEFEGVLKVVIEKECELEEEEGGAAGELLDELLAEVRLEEVL